MRVFQEGSGAHESGGESESKTHMKHSCVCVCEGGAKGLGHSRIELDSTTQIA